MVEQLSPLAPVLTSGRHGNGDDRRVPGRGRARIDRAACRLARPGKRDDRNHQGRDRPRAARRRRRRHCDADEGGVRFRAGKIPRGGSGRGAGGCPGESRDVGRPARSPTCRTAERFSGSPDRSPSGCWRNSSPSTSRCRPSRWAPGFRPCITTSSPRSSAPARTSSTSMSSAPSRAHSGSRSATRAKKSATRCGSRASQRLNVTHSSSGARSVRSLFSGFDVSS